MKIRKLLERFFPRAQPQTNEPGRATPATPPSAAKPEAGQGVAPNDLRSLLLSQIRNGRLVIPEGISEIPAHLFDALGRRDEEALSRLVGIVVPGTVKRIGERAFGDCRRLEEVILCEGVESVGSNAFSGCDSLRSLQLPASLCAIDGRAFINCGIMEPVRSADGKVFIYYPPDREDGEYAVPEGTEKIVWGAFWDAENLTRVTLPQSLKRICSKAFADCHFSRIHVPSHTQIENDAFAFFDDGVRIIRENDQSPLEEELEYCRINGLSFLCPRRMDPPQDPYWKDENFQTLARQCASGDVSAMERMGDFFLAKASHEEEQGFYRSAADFWRMRAYRYASETAGQYLNDWYEAHPGGQMVSPGLDETLSGTAGGRLLNALGFPFFDPEREYSLSGLDEAGVVEVSAWAGDEGPDEDGYGREEFYDWWYLNEHLQLPEGVGYLPRYSPHDKRCNEARFLALHDQAAAVKKA